MFLGKVRRLSDVEVNGGGPEPSGMSRGEGWSGGAAVRLGVTGKGVSRLE